MPKDILVSNIRPYFKKIWRATFEGGCSPDVLIFRENDTIDNLFLYYILSSDDFFDYSVATSKGTKMPRGDKDAIMQYVIPLPPLETQRKIASILSALDDKIELNRRMNENLEEQARAVFESLINNTTSTIPFTSIIDVLGGGTPKTSVPEYWNGEIPFFTPKDASTLYTLSTEKYISNHGLDNCNSRLFPTDTVFVTARGTVGKLSLAATPMAMNQSCYALLGKNNMHQMIVYQYALNTVNRLKHKANGAVFDASVTRDFEVERVQQLNDNQIKMYISIAEPIFNLIRKNVFESRNLAALRDTLLPKLMRGEIDVEDVVI